MFTEPNVQVGVNADRTTTVRLAGDVDTGTLDAIRDAIDATTGALILDLTGVTHLDHAGVDFLFDVAGERSLEIVMGPGCSVFPVIQVSGLCEVAFCR
jgi:anti-sigma B factor antagonist